MFSLIITIISIALVAAIAVATLYYGGSQFSQGTAKAQADQIISGAQQIAGANTLYANNVGGGKYDGSGVGDLVTQGFLSATPTVATSVGGSFTLQGGTAANTVQLLLSSTAPAVCAAIEKASGSMSASASATTAPNTTQSSTAQYDCWNASGTYTFQFKG
jgi:hypothetical protein